MKKLILLLALGAVSAAAGAEPVGRWWSGFGQGTTEYGLKNDSAGSDQIYIACAPDRTYISFTVGGSTPRPRSTVIVTIGPDEYEFLADENGDLGTSSRFEHSMFLAIWDGIRSGTNLRVRLASGQSTNFSLTGSSRVLPSEACETDFAR